jgi:fluoride ion exporter CrcB/FEX
MVIEILIAGAVAGAAYGIVGYVKNRPDEDFDWNSFGITVFGSAVIGTYAYYSGLAIDPVASSAIGVVITQAARKLWTSVKDYLVKLNLGGTK